MKTYRIKDLDLVAALITSTGEKPDLIPQGTMIEFGFPATPEIISTVASYASENLVLNARRLLTTRQRLFREIRGLRS